MNTAIGARSREALGRMNPIERLRNDIKDRFPNVEIILDGPAEEEGVWWLDVLIIGKNMTVQYKYPDMFGLSVTAEAEPIYSSHPDNTYPSEDEWRRAVFEAIEPPKNLSGTPIGTLKEEIERLRPEFRIELLEPGEGDEEEVFVLVVFISTDPARFLMATWRPKGGFGINIQYRDEPPAEAEAKKSLTYSDEGEWREAFKKAVL